MTPLPPSAEDPHRENEILRQENAALRRRLAEAEQVNEALTSGEIDAVVDAAHQAPLLLRQAQEALQASERRYRHIVEAATEGICSLDAELRISFANGAFARMLGYTPEEMVGTPVERYSFPAESNEFREHMDARRRGVAERYERRLRRKDGNECWCLVSGAPILDSDGRFAGSFKMFTDVTDRHRLEEQLRQSQKMEAVGRLAGGVAHDFNNLLTVMLGYSDVLTQGLEPGPLHEAAQEVRGAGERAAALTRQLLAFSRKQTLVPEILNLGDVVSGLSTMVERLIGEDIKVRVVVSRGLGRVKADRGQLEQVGGLEPGGHQPQHLRGQLPPGQLGDAPWRFGQRVHEQRVDYDGQLVAGAALSGRAGGRLVN